jgi:hypothetical protein
VRQKNEHRMGAEYSEVSGYLESTVVSEGGGRPFWTGFFGDCFWVPKAFLHAA